MAGRPDMSPARAAGPSGESLAITGGRRFQVLHAGERFRLELLDVPIAFELDRAHRDRGDLVGQLSVRTSLVGARTVDGVLSVGSLNASSTSARKSRAEQLKALSRAPQIEWQALLEEFCIKVLTDEAAGQPGIRLCEASEGQADEAFELVPGVPVPMRHPSILFGDGGSLKSLTVLYGLGLLAAQGVPVALFDWELDASDHRRRLARLFPTMPRDLHYVRCDRPLVYEIERLRRFTRDTGIQYAGLDSIGFGTDGPPEAAEHALAYNRALRSLGIGTMLTAHVTKNGDNNDQRPFGSAYWHNSARCTWFTKVAQTSEDGRTVSLGLFNRKNNLDRTAPASALEVRFGTPTIAVRRVDVAGVDELAPGVPIWQRAAHALKHGPMTLDRLAESIDVKPDTLRRTVQRASQTFTLVEANGTRSVSLLERGIA